MEYITRRILNGAAKVVGLFAFVCWIGSVGRYDYDPSQFDTTAILGFAVITIAMIYIGAKTSSYEE